MSKVIVIGGGASGLVAAINAKKVGNDVLLIERNPSCGKKILVTGNGRCNYFNEDNSLIHYHSSNDADLINIITEEKLKEALSFFESIGIIPKKKNGYYYPMSNQAISIVNALVLEAENVGVEIKNNILVKNIIKENEKFKVKTDYEDYHCDKVIIATGSYAAPKTGSDGMGYKFLNDLGHSMIKVLPALTQLKSDDKITSDWDGVRNEAAVTLCIDNECVKQETGEIMLTDYGVSGICIFNLSGIAAKALDSNKKVDVKINFLSNLEIDDINTAVKWFDEYTNRVLNRTISELLDGILNYKLVNAILKRVNIKKDVYWNNLKEEEKELLVNNLINLDLKIKGANSFDKAQVCSGGIPLEEINLNKMESKKVENLFVCGELLDVFGDCGGYNLTWAWVSGMLAGKGTKDYD